MPLRPRLREIVVAVIVLAYVLATPCGPPVMRAAVGLVMVLAARLMGRPRMFMNMLMAAAVIVILLRPTDILNAGFQLSFVCTAGLIVLAERVYAAITRRWLENLSLRVDAGAGWTARLEIRVVKIFCGLLTANLVGAAVALPLVAFHFGRINPYAVLAGFVALPVVALTMAASAGQLFLELVSAKLAALAAPVTTAIASFMIWVIQHLALIPGAAIAVRAPPGWLLVLLYAVVALWAMRRWLRCSRALVVNVCFAVLVITSAWYTVTQPIGEMRFEALSVGQGSTVVVRLPSGAMWLINAGSRDASDIAGHAIAPALRVEGEKFIDGMFVTALNTVAAQSAAAAITRFRPPILLTSSAEWDRRGWTFAGATAESALKKIGGREVSVSAGAMIDAGDGARLRVLWPMEEDSPPGQSGLVVLCTYRDRRLLLLDPAASASLGLLEISHVNVRADAVVLLGPERGKGDVALRKLLVATGARAIVWSGRTPFAPKHPAQHEFNTADGAVQIRITRAGGFLVTQCGHSASGS